MMPSTSKGPATAPTTGADKRRALRELAREEALALLSTVPYGRIVFTQRALPAVRPVNHIIDNGAIIIRSHAGTAITAAVDLASPTVVAYQADDIDRETRLGWSVVVTGRAQLVVDSAEIIRYEQLLQPWMDVDMNSVIRINCEIVSGYDLTDIASEEAPTS